MLEEHVFRTFSYLYERLEEGKKVIPPGQFHELRYEDLIARPFEEMQRLYERLELGGFEAYRPRLEAYWRDQAGYQTNRYSKLSDELRGEIRRRWGAVIERYGYAAPPA
jgi:hypothetical protein